MPLHGIVRLEMTFRQIESDRDAMVSQGNEVSILEVVGRPLVAELCNIDIRITVAQITRLRVRCSHGGSIKPYKERRKAALEKWSAPGPRLQQTLRRERVRERDGERILSTS